MEDHWKIIGNSRQKQVPRGYATVRYVRHLQNHQNNEWTYDGFIVPRLVQEHLYDKVIKAVESNPGKDLPKNVDSLYQRSFPSKISLLLRYNKTGRIKGKRFFNVIYWTPFNRTHAF